MAKKISKRTAAADLARAKAEAQAFKLSALRNGLAVEFPLAEKGKHSLDKGRRIFLQFSDAERIAFEAAGCLNAAGQLMTAPLRAALNDAGFSMVEIRDWTLRECADALARPARPDDLRDAQWFDHVTGGELKAGRLRKAAERGTVENHGRKGAAKNLYSIDNICQAFPEYAADIRTAARGNWRKSDKA